MILQNDNLEYKENKKHGTASLPYDIYGTFIPTHIKGYPIHWHEEIEIVYALFGQARYRVEQKEYILKKGDLLIIPPSSLHEFEQYENESFQGITYVFSQSMVGNGLIDIGTAQYIAPLFNNEIYFPIYISSNEVGVNQLSNYLDEAFKNHSLREEGYELGIRIAFLSFILYFYQHKMYVKSEQKEEDIRTTAYIKKLIRYIDEHYAEKLTLSDLAKVINISVYHMAHLFKSYTGMSPNKYINDRRLIVAAEKIRSESSKFIEIATYCGYNNISYFNRAFKEKYEMTPKEFRNRYGCCQNEEP